MGCEISVSQVLTVCFSVEQVKGNTMMSVNFRGWDCGSGDPRGSGGNLTGKRGTVAINMAIFPWAFVSFVNFCRGNVILPFEGIVFHAVSGHVMGMIPVNFSPFQNKQVKHSNIFIQRFNVFFRSPIHIFPKINDVFLSLLWLEEFV